MRALLKLMAILCFCVLPAGAQVSVAGNLKTALGGNCSNVNCFVRFVLTNYSPNVPRVTGTGIIVNTSQDMKPDANGLLSGLIWGNDSLSPSSTLWRVEFWYQGKFVSAATYSITGGTFNLNTAVPVTSVATATTSTVVMAAVTCQFAAAATTWTCTHNLASNDILYAAYDSNGVGILGSNPTKTSSNVLTVSFLVAQAGSLTVVKVGNFALTPGSLTLNDVVVKVPGAGQTIQGAYPFTFDTAVVSNINDILFVDGVKYATIDAAITAAGSAKRIIGIPSTYAGAEASTNPVNVTFWDFRGKSPVGVIPGIHFNADTGASGTAPRLLVLDSLTNPSMSTLSIWGVHRVTGNMPASQAQTAISGDMQLVGALGTVGAGASVGGGEYSVTVDSTGGTIPTVIGTQGYISGAVGSTTNLTNVYGLYAPTMPNAGTGTWANVYGLFLPAQTAGSTRNFSLYTEGDFLLKNNVALRALDTGGSVRYLFWPQSGNIVELSPLADANGWQFISIDRNTNYFHINSTEVKTWKPLNISGGVNSVNGIATVSGGIPAEYAAVNLPAQTAAITTTTLYPVPASGAGQYRLSWNAKVTAVDAVSSTLGALTIVYTDPDSVVQTITAPASVAAGTIATTNAGNVTTSVLLGMPILLNAKASTNITYAMAYASNTPGSMAYNLHIVLEKQ